MSDSEQGAASEREFAFRKEKWEENQSISWDLYSTHRQVSILLNHKGTPFVEVFKKGKLVVFFFRFMTRIVKWCQTSQNTWMHPLISNREVFFRSQVGLNCQIISERTLLLPLTITSGTKQKIKKALASHCSHFTARDTIFLIQCIKSPDLLKEEQTSISTFLIIKIFKKGSGKK